MGQPLSVADRFNLGKRWRCYSPFLLSLINLVLGFGNVKALRQIQFKDDLNRPPLGLEKNLQARFYPYLCPRDWATSPQVNSMPQTEPVMWCGI